MRPVADSIIFRVAFEIHPLPNHLVAEHATFGEKSVVVFQGIQGLIEGGWQRLDARTLFFAPGEDVFVYRTEPGLGEPKQSLHV